MPSRSRAKGIESGVQYRRTISSLLLLTLVAGCYPAVGESSGPTCRQQSPPQEVVMANLKLPVAQADSSLLVRAWSSYRERFILEDGRVVDREAHDRSTSEGQAYAMLRAVMINDQYTFEQTLTWAETNLARDDDRLWAWHWGQTARGEWQVLDRNFATDADIDAATALILAARRWQCPDYLDLAKAKLDDIWRLGTASVTPTERYLMPGPAIAFWTTPNTLILNPSYFAPYAFRLFAQVDPHHDWNSLVDSSYALLTASVGTSPAGLPSDWIQLDLKTNTFAPLPADHPLQTRYSFDAFRVWWRIALDASWFDEARAQQFLQQNLEHLRQRWQQDQTIPASLSLTGEPLVTYESTAQYAMLYAAFQVTAPLLAQQIYQKKLLPAYHNGFWDSDSSYYSQNLAWLGLLPLEPPRELLQP